MYLEASPIIAGAIKEVVPARYDIATGKVSLLTWGISTWGVTMTDSEWKEREKRQTELRRFYCSISTWI